MSKHPYTYACDFIRESDVGPFTVVHMSREKAAEVCARIAAEIGMTHEELATILSNAYQTKHGIAP